MAPELARSVWVDADDKAPSSRVMKALLVLSAASVLCTGCAGHIHKSEDCMDIPLRHYLHDGKAGASQKRQLPGAPYHVSVISPT